MGKDSADLNLNDTKDPIQLKKYDEYGIPPQPEYIRSFSKSTRFGFVSDPEGDRCPASQLPISNVSYNVCDKATSFHMNGKGYSLFFKIILFATVGICTIMLPLSLLLMVYYSSGDDCSGGFEYKPPPLAEERSRKEFMEFQRAINVDMEAYKDTLPGLIGLDTFSSVTEAYSQFTTTVIYKYYISRIFSSLCSADRILKDKYYVGFCEVYRKEDCANQVPKLSCFVASMAFYENIAITDKKCTPKFIHYISLGNKIDITDEEVLADGIIEIIKMLAFPVLLSMALWFQYWHEKYSRDLRSKGGTLGQFTILIDNVPTNSPFKDRELRKAIFDVFNKQGVSLKRPEGYRTKSISFMYDVVEYLGKLDEIKNLMSQLGEPSLPLGAVLRVISNDKDKEEAVLNDSAQDKNKTIIDQIDKIRGELKVIETRFDDEDQDLMIGKAFISFNTIEERNEVLRLLSKRFNFCGGILSSYGPDARVLSLKVPDERVDRPPKEILLDVSIPPEPQDIKWENQSYSATNRFLRQLCSIIISIIILMVGFSVMYFLKTTTVNCTIKS